MEDQRRSQSSAVETTRAEAVRDEASTASELVAVQRARHDLRGREAEIEVEHERLRLSHARLEASAGHFADLYEFAPVVYLTLDAAGCIQEANLTAASFFGRARGSLIGMGLQALVVPGERQALNAHLESCMRDNVRVDSELSFAVRGQVAVPAQLTSAPILGPEGRPTGCRTVLTDISALRWSREKLKFLNGASALLASSFDVSGSLAQIANLAVPEIADACILDLRAENGVLSRAAAVFARASKARKLEALRGAAPRAHDGSVLARVLRTGEPLLFADLSAAESGVAARLDHDPLVTASAPTSLMYVPIVARGSVHGVLTFVAGASRRRYTRADITTMSELATHAAMAMESSRLYSEAQRAVAARQDVLAFVSHDLKNPLMGIMLTTDTILRSAPGEERRRSAAQLRRIQNAVRQMRRMIDDLLDMTALETGRLAVRIENHDAAGLLEEALEQFSPQAAAGGVAVAVAPPPASLRVACDRQRVVQVLSHLVDNALKVTPSGGRISLSVRDAGERAVFAVADTGPGIAPDLRPRIFDPFVQASNMMAIGRGLGLYIAKGLVTAQGGSIWVDSAEGAGTTFSFTLPLASPANVSTFRSTMHAGTAEPDEGAS